MTSLVTLSPLAFAANLFDGSSSRERHQVNMPAGHLGQRDVAGDHDDLGSSRNSAESQLHRVVTLMHDSFGRELRHLGMIEDRSAEHACVFERSPHDLGICDRDFGIRETDRTTFNKLTDFGEFLPVVVLRDGSQWEDVAVAGSRH